MLYANGEGVSKNLPLARQFLCAYGDGIGSDPSGEELAKFDALARAGKRFDVCGKDINFGRGMDYDCLGLAQGRRGKELQIQEDKVIRIAPSPMRATFSELRKAWEAFHSAYYSMDEAMCDGGTGCGPITEDDDLQFTTLWLAAPKDVETGTPPAAHANVAQFLSLDRELNNKYRASLKFYAKRTSAENATALTVRMADRAWLVYREAWVQFGGLRSPNLQADQWRAWQTSQLTSLFPRPD